MLASLTLGGIETWLLHMLRHREMFSVEHEILLTKQEPGSYEDEVRRMGVAIHRLPIGGSKIVWLRSLRNFLADNGPFAAVHSHTYLFSAPVLAAAKRARVRSRIAHCHTARSRGSDYRTVRHKLRRAVAIAWFKRVATRRIGISDAAIEEISGPGWGTDPNALVLLYGFDFGRNRGASERAKTLRRTLGIDENAPIVGHVGRFDPVKNHLFLLDCFAAALGEAPETQLVLVGEGPIRDQLVSKAKDLGLQDKVHFAGTTDDVPAYMAMFDLFVLPSLSEGLGIVCVEAQAAGTPAIVSDAVPAEVEVVPGAVEFLPLAAGAANWGKAMVTRLQAPRPNADEWLEQVETSRFGIRRCIDELDAVYRSELE